MFHQAPPFSRVHPAELLCLSIPPPPLYSFIFITANSPCGTNTTMFEFQQCVFHYSPPGKLPPIILGT